MKEDDIFYKVVAHENGKLQSVWLTYLYRKFPEHRRFLKAIIITYTVDKPVQAPKGAPILVFDEVEFATEFARRSNLVRGLLTCPRIFSCRVKDPVPVTEIANVCSARIRRNILRFWKGRLWAEDMEPAPEGTYGVSEITLLREVNYRT